MVVRFITRRFIGEYDSSEQLYTYNTTIDKETINFEILDSSGQLVIINMIQYFYIVTMISQENEMHSSNFESNIRWAEAFILMYSITDKCSFEDVIRLKFLINYNKRRRKICKVKKKVFEPKSTTLP
jgi:hypothetical protein